MGALVGEEEQTWLPMGVVREVRALAAADACAELFGWTPAVEDGALVLSTVEWAQAFAYVSVEGRLFGVRVIVEEAE